MTLSGSTGRFGRLGAAALTLTTTVCVGCTGRDASPAMPSTIDETTVVTEPASRPPQNSLDHAISRAVEGLSAILSSLETTLLPLAAYLDRAYSIPEFATAATRAIQVSVGNNPEARLYDPSRRVDPSLLGTGAPVTQLLPIALSCDDPGLPPDAEEIYEGLVTAGGYELAHAGLGIEVMRGLGCDVPWAEAMRDTIARDLTAELESRGEIDDLAVEQLAILWFIGRPFEDPSRIQDLLAWQQPTGLWPGPDEFFAQHTSVLALWVLLAERNGSSDEPLVPSKPAVNRAPGG